MQHGDVDDDGDADADGGHSDAANGGDNNAFHDCFFFLGCREWCQAPYLTRAW